MPYALVLAQADANNAAQTDVTFQGYNLNGTANSDVGFLITPDLSYYAAGATNQITEPSSGTTLVFTPNGVQGSGFSTAWLDTVDNNGVTDYQVEFALFKASDYNSSDVYQSGTLISQSTFQVPDAQNVRMGSYSSGGASIEFLAYGDATSTTVVEFDQSGHEIASITDTSPTGVTFSDLEVLGDGRVALSYDNGSQINTDVYDFRLSGLSNPTLSATSTNYIAGTQYSDTVTGASNVNNFYYYVGSSSASPTDTFTGGSGTSWNEALFPDARSNYTITTTGGTTAIVNTGDTAHAGTLDVSSVQALAFDASQDPAPNSTGGIVVTSGETLVVLKAFTNTHLATIDAGGTLEIMAASSVEPVTFAAAGGTLQLDRSASYSGAVTGFASGDKIDLTDLTYSSSETDVWNSANNTLTISNGTQTATINLASTYVQGDFALSPDSGTGTEVVLPASGATQDTWIGSSSGGSWSTGGNWSIEVPTSSDQAVIAISGTVAITSNAVADSLTTGANTTLSLASGDVLAIDGPDESIIGGAVANAGTIEIFGPTVLDGDTLTDTGTDAVTVESGGTLYLDLAAAISGGGVIDHGTIAIIGTDTIEGGATITGGALSIATAATLKIEGTASPVTFNDDVAVANAGTIQVDLGGGGSTVTLVLEGGTIVTGGTLTQGSSSGALHIEAGSGTGATLDDVSVTNSIPITIDSMVTLFVDNGTTIASGLITNSGSLLWRTADCSPSTAA